jgi:hypothetical protein
VPSAPASEAVLPSQAAAPTAPEPLIASPTDGPLVSEKTLLIRKRDAENKAQERQEELRDKAEKEKTEAADHHKKTKERERHKRFAEKKAREDTAREQQRAQEQRQEAREQTEPFGTLAFDGDGEPLKPAGFFGD